VPDGGSWPHCLNCLEIKQFIAASRSSTPDAKRRPHNFFTRFISFCLCHKRACVLKMKQVAIALAQQLSYRRVYYQWRSTRLRVAFRAGSPSGDAAIEFVHLEELRTHLKCVVGVIISSARTARANVAAVARSSVPVAGQNYGQRDKEGFNSMKRFAIGLYISALCLSPLAASARQQQQGQSQDAPPATVQAAPPNMQQGPPMQGPPQQMQNQGQLQQMQPPPSQLTIPAGTLINVRTLGFLASNRNKVGDTFNVTLDQPLIANGWVVARRGQTVSGQVTVAKKENGNSELGITLGQLTLVDGQQVPLKTEMAQNNGTPRPVNGGDVAAVGTTTGVGAVIGAAAGGGPGAGLGAGIGAIAGLAGVMATRGRPAVIYPESLISFRLDEAVTINTGNSQMAFQPASQYDYGYNGQGGPGGPAGAPGPGPYGYGAPGGPGYGYPPYAYAAPYPYYYPYPYYGYGFYPGPFYFGFGGVYRFGGGFRGGGFRGGGFGGFRR
jgi:hypothetical protein